MDTMKIEKMKKIKEKMKEINSVMMPHIKEIDELFSSFEDMNDKEVNEYLSKCNDKYLSKYWNHIRDFMYDMNRGHGIDIVDIIKDPYLGLIECLQMKED